jgi:hypothetical protein
MNNRERIMSVFNRRKPDRLVWQPRLHHWFEVNKARGTLPKNFEGLGILEIYDDLGASPRGYHYFNDTIKTIEGDKVQLQTKRGRKLHLHKILDPKRQPHPSRKKNRIWNRKSKN